MVSYILLKIGTVSVFSFTSFLKFCFGRKSRYDRNSLDWKERYGLFVEERHALIMEQIRKDGMVRVKDLAVRFGVTEDLIRKDLAVMEKKYPIKRKYGGAILAKQNNQRLLAQRKKIPDMEAKKAIAARAMELIEPGMIVFLDISTTNVVLAEMIASSNMELTVVTNMVEIINIIRQSKAHLVAIGGELDYGHEGFVGMLAHEMLRHFRFDIAFLGAVGLELDSGAVTNLMASEGLTKRLLLDNSARRYMVCELPKLHQQGNYEFARLEEFDGVIFDQAPTAEDAEKLQNHLVEVLCA